MFSWDSFQNISECVGLLCYFNVTFLSVALIVMEIFAFIHGTLLLLILYKF